MTAEAIELTRRLAEVPELAARRRQVVVELVDKIGVQATADRLGISRQAVYKIIRP